MSSRRSGTCSRPLLELCSVSVFYWNAVLDCAEITFVPNVRFIGDSKLRKGVSISMHDHLSRLSLNGSVIGWTPVQGVPSLLP